MHLGLRVSEFRVEGSAFDFWMELKTWENHIDNIMEDEMESPGPLKEVIGGEVRVT